MILQKNISNGNNMRIRFFSLYLVLILLSLGCTRDEEELTKASFPNTADVFTDTFVDMGSDFYFPYAEAKPDVFSVDENQGYESDVSIRIDVPDADDPGGGFAGAIFRIDGVGRNLTQYNSLTFWAKASQSATIAEAGFGQDFLGDEFRAYRTSLNFTTQWRKYVIPIPDPSKLTQVRGVFQFAAGGIGAEGEEVGYSFWVDEIKFEDLGAVAQPLPQLYGGQDQTQSTFNGVTIPINDLSVIYNVDGTDVAVNATPAYFNFTSSDPQIAEVSDQGTVTVNQEGTATISGSIGSGSDQVEARGSLIVNSSGEFDSAPTPPERDAGDVVSIFSDAYDNVQVDNYNGFFQFATTQGGQVTIVDENIISYTELNFVSINMFNSPDVDASQMTHIHVDINVREPIDPGDYINFQLINDDDASSGSLTSGTVALGDYKALQQEEWVSYDIPLTDFTGLTATDDIDLIFFVSDATISSIYVDNVYFYRNAQ